MCGDGGWACEGAVHGKEGHAWQGVCMTRVGACMAGVGGMHGRVIHDRGGMHGIGACMGERGMNGRGGPYMAGGMHAGETATGGTHPTAIHSCSFFIFCLKAGSLFNNIYGFICCNRIFESLFAFVN